METIPNFPTGTPELDFTFLLQFDDDTLDNFCRIENNYINSLCNDDYFWRLRLESRGFKNLITLVDLGLFPSYRDFYIRLKTGAAAYVVIFDENPYICNNINEAYQIFLTWLAGFSGIDILLFPPIERVNELPNIVQNLQGPVTIEIYILFGEIYLGNANHLLLGVNNDPNYNVGQPVGNLKWTITPNLYQMPNLNPVNTCIFYIVSSEPPLFSIQTMIALMDINDNTMNRLIDHVLNERLYEDEFWVRKVNDNYDQEIMRRKSQRAFFYYQDIEAFISRQLPVIIINQIEGHYYMAALPDNNYGNLRWIQVLDIDRQPTFIVDTNSLFVLVNQIYSILNWQPIENLANYPVNKNYLQELRQRI